METCITYFFSALMMHTTAIDLKKLLTFGGVACLLEKSVSNYLFQRRIFRTRRFQFSLAIFE